MSSVPPSAGQTPPPPSYPVGPAGHRLGAGAIAGIMIVIILIAGGVTAAVVLSGNPSRPQPPPPTFPSARIGATHAVGAPQGTTNTTGSPAPATTGAVMPGEPGMGTPNTPATGTPNTPGTGTPNTPATGTPNTPATGTPASPGTAPTGATAGSVSIGNGISLTPAPGWTIEGNQPHSVMLLSADSTAEMFVTVGAAESTDITQVLSDDIKNLVNGYLTNIQLLSKSQVGTIQSNNFQQKLAIAYSADLQTQQGSTPVVGVFIELLNPTTQNSAYIDLHAVSDAAFNAAENDAVAMVNSML